jgi:prolyl-tRNA editing enzyme YbaK/EbsC (Cys-tRNA(Pro) deacylase)
VHEHPPAVDAAARAALPFPPERSVKTLAFAAEGHTGDVVLVALRAADRLSYAKLAFALDLPRSALRPATDEELTALGYERGGVGPSAQARTIVDRRVTEIDEPVFCGCGPADRTLEIEPRELVESAHAEIADVAAGL